jgi:hypothetical protein
MKIRAYTLDVHVGHAPCWMYDRLRRSELLTLANCKPPIRDVAPVGEWIAGVTPKRMEHRLAYLMLVGERITRYQYWERFKDSRLDSIYRPKVKGQWKQLDNPWHVDEESFRRDLSSEWVLLSNKFYVFANSYTDHATTPDGLRLPDKYSDLACGGMRGYGHFIELPDSFLAWVQKQPKLNLAEFRVLRDFGGKGCGCCKEETARSATCQ